MPAYAWITVPLGLGTIALAMLDIAMTVLHIQIESPISNHLNRRFWKILVAISNRLPAGARDGMLGWGAPLMIAGMIGLWSILYVVGFALLYQPFIHDPAVFALSDIEPQASPVDALYFSALSFFTLGYGEIVPVHPIFRLLAVLEGAFGLTTLSLSVTYLLSVYPTIARKMGLAESLNLETGGRVDGVTLAARYVAGGRCEALAQRLAGINADLLNLGQSHGLYPVLYYVRTREVHLSFVRVLAIVQGVVATLRYGLDAERYPEIVTDPRLLILEEGLLSTLHMLASSSHLPLDRSDRGDPSSSGSDFRALCSALREAGLATVSPDDRESAEAHARFRAATDRYICAYAANSGYDLDAIHAPYSRWERDTALVGHAEVDDEEAIERTVEDDAERTTGREGQHQSPTTRRVPAAR